MLAKLKIYAVIAAISLLVNVAMFAVGAHKGFGWGANSVQTKWNAAKLQNVDNKLNVKVKQDEIQVAPIDHNVTNRRLFNGSF